MISFGSDPEFMLEDSSGNLKSAIGVIPGTKDERHDIQDGHAVYYDNVLAECSMRPGNTKAEVVGSFQQCLQRFAEVAAPNKLALRASGHFPESELEHEDAQAFGCDPEFCAYALNVIIPPECAGTFRSAGGHMHIGFDGGKDFESGDGKHTDEEVEELNIAVAWNRIWVVRMADIFVGIPSLFLDQDPTSQDRRQLYGVAGSHRACPDYGVEYRSLGNFWLGRPSLVELMYDLAEHCVKIVMEDRSHEKIWEAVDEESLRQTINTWSMEGAETHLQQAVKLLPKGLATRLQQEREKENGDFYEQWKIKL